MSPTNFFSKSGLLAWLMKKSHQFTWCDWAAWCHRGRALVVPVHMVWLLHKSYQMDWRDWKVSDLGNKFWWRSFLKKIKKGPQYEKKSPCLALCSISDNPPPCIRNGKDDYAQMSLVFMYTYVTSMDQESGWKAEHYWIYNKRTIQVAVNQAGMIEPCSTSHREGRGYKKANVNLKHSWFTLVILPLII
jgi:hypothetical protein